MFGEFKKFIKISDRAFDVAVRMAENLIKMPISEMNIQDMSSRIRYSKVLLIHDKADKVLPYANSEAVKEKWHNSELVTLEKIGHYRMLWNEYVVNSIAKFLEPTRTIKINSGASRLAA